MKDNAHVLVGVVSKARKSCMEQDFAVYTSVSAIRQWIDDSIMENGGMASCGDFQLSAPPSPLNVNEVPSGIFRMNE